MHIVVLFQLSMHSKTMNRGLAFVEMGSAEEALAALNSLESSVSIFLSLVYAPVIVIGR